MGERKVLNKYYPPDFDPAKLPRGRRGNKDEQMKVRMMLPMSIRCNTCGVYMYKGTKFNTRKEDVHSEKYLDTIMVFRFYFRCSKCGAEITMKTDPKNSDYTMEHGATRNYEPWREKDKAVGEAIAARAAEEEGNAMKALENRTLDSKREMDIMGALDELQSLNRRQARVDFDQALAALQRSAGADEDGKEVELDEEDEEALRAMYQQQRAKLRRIDDSALEGRASAASTSGGQPAASGAQPPPSRPPAPVKPAIGFSGRPPAIVIKKRKAGDATDDRGGAAAAAKPAPEPAPAAANGGGSDGEAGSGGLLGLGGYGSSGSDSPS